MEFVHSKVGNLSVDITKASAETEFAVRSEAETTFADTKRKQSKERNMSAQCIALGIGQFPKWSAVGATESPNRYDLCRERLPTSP